MKEDEQGDEKRDRSPAGRGVTSSNQPGSPPRGPRRGSDSSARRRPSNKVPSTHARTHRQSSRDRDRGGKSNRRYSHTARGEEKDDLIPRYRASKTEPHSYTSGNGRGRGRDRPGSPTSPKRQRSRSRSSSARHRKKSRRDATLSPRGRDIEGDSSSRRRRHHSPSFQRQTSPYSRGSPSRRPENTVSSATRASRSRSPNRPQYESIRSSHRPREPGVGRSRRHSRSRSPGAEGRHMSQRPSHSSRDPSSSDIDPRHSRRDRPAASPTERGARRHRRGSPEGYHSARSDIDDDMEPRGAYRGGHSSVFQQKSSYRNESRGYSQSNSPSQSPYSGARPGRGGRYSPNQQYPAQNHQGSGSQGPPTGPASHYQQNSSSYGSRGGFRGGYRGGPPTHIRGSYRNSDSSESYRGVISHTGSSRTDYPPEDSNGGRQSMSGEDGPGGESMDLDDNGGQHLGKDQAEESSQPNKNDDTPRGPSGRPPPTGPSNQGGGSGKFSFAFKPSSKPQATAPKPEISQKFNAAPKRRESPERPPVNRDPPMSAPKQPASTRPRPDSRVPLDGPRMAPRMRKVKKIMKRLKPRPVLPADLAASDSVFFRKPGNESVVGSGTYGKVFKGLNVYTKDLVALKRIRMEGERDGFPVTAVREIKLLQSLRHPNIVNLQEVMVEKNDCFMVFEYLSHDLTGLLNHPTFKLEPAQKKHLAKQLFDSLAYLHSRGVLHRDIKAANILVSSDGILKLADFGLARFYAKRHQLDYTNRVITIWYRSPELLLGETQYTAAVDVWSAACVMIEIFSRHAIFAGDGTELSQLDKIYNVLGTPNRQDWPGLVDMAWFELLRPTAKRKNVFAEKYKDKLTPAAFDLLAAMFQYDPAKRPTAAEVLQHPYFTTEEPLPRQAVELAGIDGDWHEFESKALRKENERREREARKASRDGPREKDKKRPIEQSDQARNAKRVHVEDKNTAARPEGGQE